MRLEVLVLRPRELLAIALATVCALLGGRCSEPPDGTLVAAAMSLRHAFLEIGDAYRDRHPRDRLRFQFAASGVLVRQAMEGAPFDVIALAGDAEMDRLENSATIEPGSRVVFATNRLVIGVPPDGVRPVALRDLADAGFSRIAIGSPSIVPAGRYAREVLTRAGLWGQLAPRLVFTQHARQVVEYLERGEVDAGILYASDAEELPWLRVAVEIDPSLHDPIRYPVAMTRDAVNGEGARRFLRWLEEDLGQVILRRHGFGPPVGDTR